MQFPQSMQPLLSRIECKSLRSLSGSLASTPHPVSCDHKRRWQKCSRWSGHQDDCGWGGASCSTFGDREALIRHGLLSQKCQKKSLSKFRSLIQFCHETEAPTDSRNTVTLPMLWESLKPAIKYLSVRQLSMVKDALKLAFEAHSGQKRRSGEPFIIHPVEVARILGELEMDWETIVAGLLHDTVEDTDHVTFERIEEQFGPVVRRIVEGETKVSKLGKMQCQGSDSLGRDVKADDLRQMFLAMTEEVRVIIVKLADRLHNMRTLSHMPLHKQQYIAQETLQVFAPLAKLLGMHRIKSELEDLSFMFAHPEEHALLKSRVESLSNEQRVVVLEAKQVLLDTILKDQFLGYMTVDVKVLSLCKELFSLYKKIFDSKCSVDEIQDIAQLRVILTMKPGATVDQICSVQQVCYHVLGLVHAMWPPVPQTMKDYIATPKPNGYQSLHTTVIPFGSKAYFPLEIQIRTEEMDKLAEFGIAAHHSGIGFDSEGNDSYSRNVVLLSNGALNGNPTTHSSCNLNDAEIARRVSWLNSIREWQEEFVGNMTSREFVDTITGDLLGSRVFVFTPKGEVKNLPKGATVIDYAYQIHTDLGNKMVAAKVNGNLVSPTHTLANAEVVEILTHDGVATKKIFELHRQWLHFAKTRSARHKLTKFLKEQATLSAVEITADTVNDFVSDFEENEFEILDEEESESLSLSSSFAESSGSEGSNGWIVSAYLTKFPFPGDSETVNSLIGAMPAVNGKKHKLAEELAMELAGDPTNGATVAWSRSASLKLTSVEEEARAVFEAWQSGRVAMWHGSGGRSIQWFSVCCIDRKSMLAEVTALFGASGVLISACAAETNRIKGLGIMIFHVEGSMENLANACAHIHSISGVLNWAVGCSWQRPHSIGRYV